MPYSTSNPPTKIKGLPEHAKAIWIAAFNSALKQYEDEGKATATAWAAVKKSGYEQDDKGEWHKSNAIIELWENVKRLFTPLVDKPETTDLQVTLPTLTRSLTITRDSQGVPRWLMIAASAVVNKVNAIDSTTLFDNFIRHAAEDNSYPILDFFHEGERVRFGQADWLRRDGALYLASGGFDDTELARGAIAGIEAQADYWGASIAYRVTQAPLMLIAEGEIPVYMDGVNNFISIVPKRLAANLFTATLIAEEVRRMNTAVYEELVKLVGEERAKQFAEQVDDANRTITDTGMVTRADDTPVAQVEIPAPIAPVVPVAEVVTQPDEPPEEHRVDLAGLEAKIEALAARIAKLEGGEDETKEESKRAQQRALDTIAELATRMAGVEASKARWDEWLNDAPEHVKAAEGIHRARNQESAPMTMEQLAKQNVGKLHRGPHYSRHGND